MFTFAQWEQADLAIFGEQRIQFLTVDGFHLLQVFRNPDQGLLAPIADLVGLLPLPEQELASSGRIAAAEADGWNADADESAGIAGTQPAAAS